MTDYKFNTRIEWTEEDRKRGECPVPDGSDVTVRLGSGTECRDEEPQGWNWAECDPNIIAYMIHSIPREPREWYVAVDADGVAQLVVQDAIYPGNREIIKVREVMEEDA